MQQINAMIRRAFLFISLSMVAAQAGGIAVDPSGSMLFSAEKRTIYQHDPQSLKVTHKLTIETQTKDDHDFINQLEVNRAGDLLFCVSGAIDKRLSVIQVKSGKPTRVIDNIQSMGAFGHGVIWFISAQTEGVLIYKSEAGFHVMDMTTGKDLRTFPPVVKKIIRCSTLSADGKVLAILTKSSKNDEAAAPPSKGRNLEDRIQNEKHDGKGSIIAKYDTTTGKLISQTPIWYSGELEFSSATCAFFHGDDLLINNSSVNFNAKVSPDGSVSIFNSIRIDYGLAVMPDGSRFAAGALFMERSGYIENLKNPDASCSITQVKQGDADEYFSSMVFDGKGTLYGLTSKFRIFRVNEKGVMEAVAEIH